MTNLIRFNQIDKIIMYLEIITPHFVKVKNHVSVMKTSSFPDVEKLVFKNKFP